MSIPELVNLFDNSDYYPDTSIIYDDGDIRTPIYFDKFGLQAWFSCNLLVNASIADYTDNFS